jgi:Protein of unknown function (DUF2854)
MFRKLPLAILGQSIGGVMTAVGFYAYATDQPTLNLACFFYGIPLLLGGLALKAAELKPVPVKVELTPEVLAARTEQATKTQLQIFYDVTRYRYGQEAHLDAVLTALGMSPTQDQRPVITGIWELLTGEVYTLVMEFESPLISLETWQGKEDKMTRFFGPDVKVKVSPSPTKEDAVEVAVMTSPGECADLEFQTEAPNKRTFFM